MPYPTDPYTPVVYQDIADPNNPPPGAEPMSAENFNHENEGIRATREGLHLALFRLDDNELNNNNQIDEYPISTFSVMTVTTGSGWPAAGGILFTIRHRASTTTDDTISYDRQEFHEKGSNRVWIRHALTNSKTPWAANTPVTFGDFRQPTTDNGFYYRCTQTGTTGGSQPTWPTDNSTVTDGTATWVKHGSFWSPWVKLIDDSDTRLTNARTPSPHNSSHYAGGSDPLTPFDINAAPTTDPSFAGRVSYTSNTQAISAASDAILANARNKLLNPGSVLTLTSQPTIANGQDGQVIKLINVGNNALTLRTQGGGGSQLANSNLRLASDEIVLAPRSSVELTFVGGSINDWYQTSAVVNIPV